MSVLFTPIAILRMVTIVCAIIMFATMADSPFFEGSHTFKYIVACGVLVFIWAIVALVILFLGAKVAAVVNPVVLQLAVDAVFVIMTLIAAIVGAAKCGDEYKAYCDHYSTPNASVAFAFITSVCLVIALVMNFLKYKSGASGAQA